MRVSKRLRIVLTSSAALVLLAAFATSQIFCLRAFLLKGIVAEECPDGDLRQTVFIEGAGLRRGVEGVVRVGGLAHYTTDRSDEHFTTSVRRLEAAVHLVKGRGEEVALRPKKDWEQDHDFARRGLIALPTDLPDGDYTLRARVRSPIGEDTLDVPLAVYAPARVHVITDRPLYEPGNVVQFRAVALRAKDLAPIDGRPGKWIITDPEGEVVLEERAPAGDLGVASGTFPLDSGAPTGDWRVRWTSGGAEDEVSFRVEPFTLPRFSVEAAAPKTFYRRGERPSLRGRATYASGAPVREASLDLEWSVGGAWPPPSGWLTGELPKQGVTDAAGSFDLVLPVVPGDLRGRVTLSARIAATDSAGDRVEGRAAILLSEDAIAVSAVTELDDGLVEGFNNRVYLRVTSASGAVLPNTEVVVKRAWEASDRGVTATTDEDGVAALQIDPGPPVNVVIPPMPARPPPRVDPVRRTEAEDALSGEPPSLAELRAMDAWDALLAPCARFIEGSESVQLAASVDSLGTVHRVAIDGRPVSICMADGIRGKKLPSGRDRFLRLEYAIASDLPRISVDVSGVPNVPPGLERALHGRALEARACLPEDIGRSDLPRVLIWSIRGGTTVVDIGFASEPRKGEPRVPQEIAACVERTFSKLSLEEEEEREGERQVLSASARYGGLARLAVEPSARFGSTLPVATTMLGYELSVTARAGTDRKEEIGATKILIRPGQIPAIRLRASPVLADPGGEVEVAILRGPGFSTPLPEKLPMTHELGTLESKVDPKTRAARFTLPDAAKGWFEVRWLDARALVYVAPKADLRVAVAPDRERYAPGETAELTIRTTALGQGVPAGVGLVGVDASLGDLVPLPGPDDMARIRPKAEMRSPAFDTLDAGALSLGRVRGKNAAAAIVLRVSRTPPPAELDVFASAAGYGSFEPLEALTDNFYNVLAELHARVREWEGSAPPGEQMHPATLSDLWARAIAGCEARKEAVTDAYGRRLRLHQLPSDLLALTDPRVVVMNGTRLPEDIENWSAWVKEKQP